MDKLPLDYIPLFLDFYDRFEKLSYEELGRLVRAMLAYARGEDPAPHLTEALESYCFPSERGVIDRTAKAHQERREKRRNAALSAINARYQRTETEANVSKRMQTYANVCKRRQSYANGA